MKKLFLLLVVISLPCMLFADPLQDLIASGPSIIGEVASSTLNMMLAGIGTIFDKISMQFEAQFRLSMDNITESFLPALLWFLLLAELLWIALQMILQREISIQDLFIKFFIVILILLVLSQLTPLMGAVRSLFVEAGVAASGNESEEILSSSKIPYGYTIRPSDVAFAAQACLYPVQAIISSISTWLGQLHIGAFGIGWGESVSVVTYVMLVIPAWLALAGSYIVEFICFVILAFTTLSVTMAIIEFSFLLVVAMVCLPWQIFTPTKFMAGGLWQCLFGQCIKLFVIMYLVLVGPSLIGSITVESMTLITESLSSFMEVSDPAEVVFPSGAVLLGLVQAICIVIAWSYLLLKGPAMAFGLLTGTPTMDSLGTHAVMMSASRALGAAGGLVVGSFLHPVGSALGHARSTLGRGGRAVGNGVRSAIGNWFNRRKHI